MLHGNMYFYHKSYSHKTKYYTKTSCIQVGPPCYIHFDATRILVRKINLRYLEDRTE